VIVSQGNASRAQVYFDAFEAVVLNKFDGADTDRDGDEDLHDFAWLQQAFTDPGGPMEYMGIVFDHDDDDDVDMANVNYFLPRLTGPLP
jgi:hypothetical protein